MRLAGVVVLNAEANIIRSLELKITLDIPTARAEPDREGRSLAFMTPVALMEPSAHTFKFVTNGQYTEQQITPDVFRLGATYHLDDPDTLIGRKIDALAAIDLLLLNYGEFVRMVAKDKVADGSATFNMVVMLNGMKVISFSSSPPMKDIMQGMASMNVAQGFSQVVRLYREQVAIRASQP